MNEVVKTAFNAAMMEARSAYRSGDYDACFQQLKRAHILGQRHLVRHWVSHWWMLKVGLKMRDRREIFGQLVRLLAVVPGFLVGWVPIGNTGAADVSALRPMPLPNDLSRTIGDISLTRDVFLRVALLVVIFLLLVIM
ncbi:DUF3703 domain-containing protein [Kordiimonas sp.]|uniref:DUF3703 domain-containing protein n=1 Tax=Kordiimonas sp. TaxID=1970157 RepID=UPI003A901D49